MGCLSGDYHGGYVQKRKSIQPTDRIVECESRDIDELYV